LWISLEFIREKTIPRGNTTSKTKSRSGKQYFSLSTKKETYSLSLTLDDIILFLQNYKKTYEFTNLQSQIKTLETENHSLLQRVTMYEEEYRMLLNHIDKTRSLVEIN
jgi:FtsZ-binding cell division protein ZapB